MKLSDAIRLGAMLRPQIFGDLSNTIGTCAIGAAAEALGATTAWFALWGRDKAMRAACPQCGAIPDDELGSLLTPAHLNDNHRWTRERIADWVESVERAHEPQAPALQSLSLVGVGVSE